MTARQIELSHKISEVIPDFPASISDLISELAQPDFSLAMHELELNKKGEAINNQRNSQIITCIEQALTAPSCECDPKIKAAIFFNARDKAAFPPLIKPYLVRIVNELKARREQIILDDTELENLNFGVSGIDLSGMSARRAAFKSISMKSVNLDGVDFRGAVFIDTCLVWSHLNNANITDARFVQVSFHDTEAHGLIGNQSGLRDRVETKKYVMKENRETTEIDATYLTGMAEIALPDAAPFTLPAKKNGQRQRDLIHFFRF